jgi:branched-chain amino acid transport system ATP-binding protein
MKAEEALLRAEAISKHYGGLRANHRIDLTLNRGEIHALIGPNGAGKSTLIAQLSGELAPSAGRILFRGRDITRLPVHRRARLGIARSFQVTSLFGEMSVAENLALAVQAHHGHSFRFWRAARDCVAINRQAEALARRFGLGERLDLPAAALAYGEQRQLEVALALAGNPPVLLLDEPMAGIGAGGTRELTRLLDGLRDDHALLLVEHDMQAVFALADRITVLVYGEVIASGSVDEIRSNPEVQRAYLGEERSVGAISC